MFEDGGLHFLVVSPSLSLKLITWMSVFAFPNDFENSLKTNPNDFWENMLLVVLLFGVSIVSVGVVAVLPARRRLQLKQGGLPAAVLEAGGADGRKDGEG